MTSVALPRFIRVRQIFPPSAPIDIAGTLRREFERVRPGIKPGARIAVAVGSRGIANLDKLIGAVLQELRQAGAAPFIVPAMGSHGGATPEGQVQLLAEYGVTEERMGAPIRAAMDAQRLGVTPDGIEVLWSSEALRSDGVVVVNRVKPHTDFQSETLGSGLLKMLVVGLGKQAGAANFHAAAMRLGYPKVLATAAQVALATAPVLCGVAVVENQFHDTAQLKVLLPQEIESREPELFRDARRLMPRLPFDDIDLLIVDRLGKNISGAGMDPNVTGRGIHGYSAQPGGQAPKPVVRRLFVRELTPESHGNAVGLGLADFTTTRLVRARDERVTFMNALTALSLQSVKVPIHFESDRECVSRALESLALADTRRARVARITDTLNLEHLQASEAYLEEIRGRKDLETEGDSEPLQFDAAGNFAALAG
jgi:hypothetical protein